MLARPRPGDNPALRRGAALLLLPLLPLTWLHLALPADDRMLLVVDDLGEMVYAAIAAGSAAWRAHRSRGRLRKAWIAFAVGCAAWAAGEAIWSWYDLRGFEPFPTLADAGFLVLPVAACVGIWLYPGIGGSRRRQLQALDSLTVTVALAFVSWATVLGAVFRGGRRRPAELRRRPGLPGRRPGCAHHVPDPAQHRSA